MTKVLLFSGGTDSWLIDKLWKPDVRLYVEMDSMYSGSERSHMFYANPDIRKDIEMSYIPLSKFEDEKTAFIPGRNMYLLLHAAQYGDEICLGATKEDIGGSSDKDLDFLDEAEHLLNRLWAPQSLYGGKQIKIERQFMQYTKAELIDLYLKQGGDINEFKNRTFSCYHPDGGDECLDCKACFRKFVACYGHGAEYSESELKKMYEFAEENVVHRSHHAEGRYFLDKPNAIEVLEVLKKLYSAMGKELNLR